MKSSATTPAKLLCLILSAIGWTIMLSPDQTNEEQDHQIINQANSALDQCVNLMTDWRAVTNEFKKLLEQDFGG